MEVLQTSREPLSYSAPCSCISFKFAFPKTRHPSLPSWIFALQIFARSFSTFNICSRYPNFDDVKSLLLKRFISIFFVCFRSVSRQILNCVANIYIYMARSKERGKKGRDKSYTARSMRDRCHFESATSADKQVEDN